MDLTEEGQFFSLVQDSDAGLPMVVRAGASLWVVAARNYMGEFEWKQFKSEEDALAYAKDLKQYRANSFDRVYVAGYVCTHSGVLITTEYMDKKEEVWPETK